jgi:P-type Cu+ transporter
MTVAELAIGGMTCASCAARIERKLNRLDGVSAAVNFATETARVTFPAGVQAEDLVSAVERAGYTAVLAARQRDEPAGPAESGVLRGRLLVSLALAVPVVLLGMVPAWQFPGWPWVGLALASPVAVWGAWPFHRAALAGARHGAATMDTLISVGVAAAYLWSLYALVFGSAGRPGARMGFAWLAQGSGAEQHQPAEEHGVARHHPRQLAALQVQGGADIRQRHVHHRDVQDEHQLRGREQGQRHPAGWEVGLRTAPTRSARHG